MTDEKKKGRRKRGRGKGFSVDLISDQKLLRYHTVQTLLLFLELADCGFCRGEEKIEVKSKGKEGKRNKRNDLPVT